MPYIKQDKRKDYDKLIYEITCVLLDSGPPGKYGNTADVGDLNYVISSIIWNLFDSDTCYSTGNNLMGVLECVKQEFYRRKLSEYENIKIKENGDL